MSDTLTKRELDTLIKLSKKVLWADPETRAKIQAHNINIIPANFYSNIPSVENVHSSFEYKDPTAEIYNNGEFDRKTIEEFVDQICQYAADFNPPLEGDRENPSEYFWKNPAFSFSDAMSYYCVIRHFKPDHILEIGSGFSTLVADQAIKKNGKGKLTLIEPYPKAFLKKLDTVDQIIESFVQDIPVNDLVNLVESADIWFIDSTHTVKIGSDCLYIYLLIMPKVKKDIIVHTHDIYLPFGSQKNNALNMHIYWTEQYLLYAYMLDNPKIKVLFGSTYVHKVLPDAMNKLMQDKYSGGGASIWYRLNGTVSA